MILEIIKDSGSITGKDIAKKLFLSRAALRSDLAILSMAGLIGAKPKVGYFYNKALPSPCFPELSKILVADNLSRSIVVRETSTVYDAIVTMFMEDVGTIFVVSEGGILEGAVSRKDLLKTTMGNKNINELPVSIIMTRTPNIIFTTPEESVLEAAQKLLHHEIDALPVVTNAEEGDHKKLYVTGRFTKSNITRLFVRLAGNNRF
jgi:CBS domain-containing protein